MQSPLADCFAIAGRGIRSTRCQTQVQPASTVAKDNREYEELASTSGPQSQISLTFSSSSPGFPAKHTDPTAGSLPCHTSYHTPPASLPSHTSYHTPPARLPSHTATTTRQQAYPVTPPPHPASKLNQSHRHHTPPASLPSHTATTPHLTIVTELETAKQDTKTELELHVHQLTDTVTSLTQKLTELTKQNKDLKLMI